MTETQVSPDQEASQSQDLSKPQARPRRRIRPRKLGCGLALLLWFTLLLTPCALFFLAANGEIRLNHRDLPAPHAHPLLLVSLISEAADRGLRLESSWIAKRANDDQTICVETAVRFLLWEYSGGNQNVNYCDCYERPAPAANWELSRTFGAACSAG